MSTIHWNICTVAMSITLLALSCSKQNAVSQDCSHVDERDRIKGDLRFPNKWFTGEVMSSVSLTDQQIPSLCIDKPRPIAQSACALSSVLSNKILNSFKLHGRITVLLWHSQQTKDNVPFLSPTFSHPQSFGEEASVMVAAFACFPVCRDNRQQWGKQDSSRYFILSFLHSAYWM